MNFNKGLIGKKLLILGANPETVPLIETAKEMGVHVLVTDNNPDAFAKTFADQSFDVDGMDIDGMVDLAKKEQVDGVLVGVADRLIKPYQKVCDRLELPSYASEEQCEILTDKGRFNTACEKFDIPTIPNYPIDQHSDVNEIKFEFPLLVKPVDGNSGKGITICHSASEVDQAIVKAKGASKRGKFLIEKYMDCDDMFIYYTFRNGEVLVSAIADRYTSTEQGDLGKVCIGATYPSKYATLYFEKLHSKMISLFTSLGMKNGVLMISAFVKNENIYLYDPGFRLQGEAPNIPIEAICGYDHKEMLVNFALSGSMGPLALKDLINSNFDNKHAATLWILSKKGEIKKILGLDEIKKSRYVYKIVQRLYEGDVVTQSMIGTEAQVVARIYLTSNSKDELVNKIREFARKINVLGPSNNKMNLLGLESLFVNNEDNKC